MKKALIMKRIKFMMLSLALLAVVGGALAFKAKFQGLEACYTTTTVTLPQFSTCIDATLTYTTTDINPVTIYTTPKVDRFGVLQCEFDANGNPLTICTTAISVKKDI